MLLSRKAHPPGVAGDFSVRQVAARRSASGRRDHPSVQNLLHNVGHEDEDIQRV